MKLVRKPIEVISWSDEEGNIKPLKIKILDDIEGNIILKIHRITLIRSEKKNGSPMKIFRCESIHFQKILQYELRYDAFSGKWILLKI